MVDGVIIGKRITTSEKWSRITVGEKRWFLIELKDREKKNLKEEDKKKNENEPASVHLRSRISRIQSLEV